MYLVTSTNEATVIKIIRSNVLKSSFKSAFKRFYDLVGIDTPLVYTSYVDKYWLSIFREDVEDCVALVFKPFRLPDYSLPNNPLPFIMVQNSLWNRKEIDGVNIELDNAELKILFTDSVVFSKSLLTRNCVKEMIKKCPNRTAMLNNLVENYIKILKMKHIPKEIMFKATNYFKSNVISYLNQSDNRYTEVLFHDDLKIKPIAVIHPKGKAFVKKYSIALPVYRTLNSAFGKVLPRKQY